MATDGSAASIGKSVQIHGEVKGSEDLVVDGTIEGTITLSESRLPLAPMRTYRPMFPLATSSFWANWWVT